MYEVGDSVQTLYGIGKIVNKGQTAYTIEVLNAHLGVFHIVMTSSELDLRNPLPAGNCPVEGLSVSRKCECGQGWVKGLVKHSDYCPLYKEF